MLLFVTLVWFAAFSPALQSPASDCATAATCRAQALIAEAAGDFEHFHDLAWRAVQKGKPNDPELMVMLARAMALSGRPGDAIVMLSRLADMSVKVDVSGDEFRVVRTLKEWPDVEAKLSALTSPVVTDAAPPATEPATAKETPPKEPKSRTSPPSPRAARTEKPAAEPATAEPKNPEPKNPEPKNPEPANRTPEPPNRTPEPPNPRTPEPVAELSFSAPTATTSGLAYDAVSRRFVVGDRTANGLMVIDEMTEHVVPLVSAAGAGFYDHLAAFRIDPRRGDLWVVSARTDGDHAESVLHKLQLVSGRPIFEVQATSFGEVRFVDVAIDADGTVYALDAADSRIFRLRPGSRTLELVTRTTIEAPTAFDVVGDRTAFVAGSAGVTRVDLATGHASRVATTTPLGEIVAVDAYGGILYLLQKSSDGEQLVRGKLDRAGRTITASSIIDGASAIGRAGEKLYYLAAPGIIKSVRQEP